MYVLQHWVLPGLGPSNSQRIPPFPFHGSHQADIHSFYKDGAVALHARSLKYGKVWREVWRVQLARADVWMLFPPVQLENGQFVSVPPVLVKRLKQHFVSLPCGVDVILGNNGYIWVTGGLQFLPQRRCGDSVLL